MTTSGKDHSLRSVHSVQSVHNVHNVHSVQSVHNAHSVHSVQWGVLPNKPVYSEVLAGLWKETLEWGGNMTLAGGLG